MAQIAEYEVLHPVRHNGYFHPRGSSLKLTVNEGSRLIQLQAVRPKEGAAVIEVADDVLADNAGAYATFGEKTKAELVEFAKATLGLTLSATAKKEEIVASILNAQVPGVAAVSAVPSLAPVTTGAAVTL